jgi:hypothetical protein
MKLRCCHGVTIERATASGKALPHVRTRREKGNCNEGKAQIRSSGGLSHSALRDQDALGSLLRTGRDTQLLPRRLLLRRRHLRVLLQMPFAAKPLSGAHVAADTSRRRFARASSVTTNRASSTMGLTYGGCKHAGQH